MHTFLFRFTYAIEIVLPLLLVLAWILPVAMLCKNIVYEKEKRLKEVMRMMGLGNGVHWLAWFINAFVVMMFTMGLLVVLLTVSHNTIHMQEYGKKISLKCFWEIEICKDINFNEYINNWNFCLQIAVVIVGINNISSPSVQSSSFMIIW